MSGLDADALDGVAAALGESPARMQAALAGVVPALLAGIATAVTTPAQAEMLLGTITRHRFEGGPNGVASAMTVPGGISNLTATGRPLLESLLRGRTSSVADWVTGLSGIGKSSSLSLMSLALPLVLGQIGGRVRDMGWSASSLLGLLAEQRSLLQNAPAGLQSLFGLKDVPSEPRIAFERVPAVHDDETGELEPMVATVSRRRSALMWALPFLLLIPIVAYFVSRSDSGGGSVVRNAAGPEVPSPVATAGVAALGPFVERELPDNTTLRIPTDGVESKLIGFIEDTTKAPDSETWFTFDRLEFETGSARLAGSATEQLRNVAAILRAYPSVKVKIGGYTDNVADASHNLQLSQERANAAMLQIISMGIDAARVAAEGYGEQHPVADNATAEGRQRNRRVDIRVTDK
jgi:outer membrane protein OmpA-like peptidoglycan-associated protein